MLTMLLGEALGLVIPAIKLGIDITEVIERATALAKAPVPATEAELAEFRGMLDAQRAVLEAKTKEIESGE